MMDRIAIPASRVAMAFALLGSVPVGLGQPNNAATPREAAGLFEAVPGEVVARDAHALSRRAVTVNFTMLDALEQAGGGALTLNLLETTAFQAQIDQVESRLYGRYSLSGHIAGAPGGTVQLVVHDGVLVGVIHTNDNRTFDIRYTPEGVHVVREVQPRTFGRCAVEPRHGVAHEPDDSDEQRPAEEDGVGDGLRGVGTADDGSTLDVLVVYSNVTRAAAGGTAAIEAEVQLAVDVANGAYSHSAMQPRLRLVHTEEIAYDEAAFDFGDHLDRLWGMTDGYMDSVHELRDRVGADFVSLIVEDNDPDIFGNGTCGVGYVMGTLSTTFERDAFTVVNRECAADNWSFAHEVGHNQGCAHNRENAGVDGLYTYSYGHRFTGTNGVDYRTIMSYIGDGDWIRVNHFSNPNIMHQGTPTGVPVGQAGEAHNAQTIDLTRFTTARFRGERTWVDPSWGGAEDGLFATPHNTLIEGIAGSKDDGTVVMFGGAVPYTGTISKPLLLNAYGGSAVIE